jgi:predicted tellurium resistance membrane protein TerC
MAVRSSVVEASLLIRLSGTLAVGLLVPASALLVRLTANSATFLRQATLILGAIALSLLAWALPDPDGAVPWLNRHAGLFAALTLTAATYLESRRSGRWSLDLGRVGIMLGGLALVALGIELIQQIPQFDPNIHVRKTPLDPVAVAAVLAGILALIVVGLRLALRPDRDPLGPAPHGRTGYVYLAEVLLVLMFAHVRLNVPQVFTGQAVRYWTFIVMLLAFIGVGLAELFARRGLHVLSRPLLRTGVLLPLIPLLVFWAKPPGLVFEFADARAPGLRPMLGYLEKLPQHFDAYALLWFLAGLLYGLVALSRRSFGWALLGALATNAGLWALLAHHQVPAAVHPQAWAIPLALIVLVSEHVNRYRLRTDVASGLRYLGISMIYVASAADLFIAGVGESLWLPIVLAVLCLAGVVAGVLLRVRAFLYLSIGFLLLDVFSMIWHAAVDRAQTWVWYASGIVLGVIILTVFAILEKRRNDVQELVGRLREWD